MPLLFESSREPGKSDPIDAEAVALVAQGHPDLPIAELDGPTREVEQFSDHRHDLVVQRTQIAVQVRCHMNSIRFTGPQAVACDARPWSATCWWS